MSQQITEDNYPAGLGVLRVLPREIRDKIYLEVLSLNHPAQGHYINTRIPRRPTPIDFSSPTYECKSGVGLLCSSRIIYDEALPALYQSNEFTIIIDADKSRWNEWIRPYESVLTHASNSRYVIIDRIKEDMLRHMRNIVLFVPINEARPSDYQSSRETRVSQGISQEITKSLMYVMEETCSMLQKCVNINELLVKTHSFCGTIDEKLFGPILALRGCNRTEIWISGGGRPVPQLTKVCGDNVEVILDFPRQVLPPGPRGSNDWRMQPSELRSRLTFFDWNIRLRKGIEKNVVTISHFILGVSN